ncbi:hypothetical protein [Stieleria mannarensis]|uniref:hypothetical protein n=1 Tax=Stieleria mannarensis TaxID=2755585 RepID=UPI0015FFD735|nr:hypothetical protein [Rhodopirellula sp. JC639]
MNTPFPNVSLKSGISLDDAFERVIKEFEDAGIYVQRHELSEPLPGIAKVFSCHEDGRNDMFIVRVEPWDLQSASAITAFAESLSSAPDFMKTTSYNFVSPYAPPQVLVDRLDELT